jgi:hypothetical protein
MYPRLGEDLIAGIHEVWISSEVLKERDECHAVIDRMSQHRSSGSSGATWVSFMQATKLHFESCCSGPLNDGSVSRSSVAIIELPTDECIRFKIKLVNPSLNANPPASVPFSNPFPPPYYPSYFLGADHSTVGNWVGTYGAAGYYLAAFDGTDRHRALVGVL